MIISAKDAKKLESALEHRRDRVGLKEGESALLHKYDRAMEHGERIRVSPVSSTPVGSGGAKPNIAMEDVEGLQKRMSQLNNTESQENDSISVVGSNGKLNLVAKHSTWVTPTDFPTELGQTNYPAYFNSNITGVMVKNLDTSYQLNINVADITKNMTIKEVDVCVGGVNKKMLILASDPY
jgi:hypothetical protein